MVENSINTQITDPKSYQVKNTVVSNPVLTTSSVSKNLNGKTALRDEFVKEKKKTGLFERFYDFCKNKTGIGLGSKKVEKAISDCETGNLSEVEVRNKISEYKVSRENAEQNFGDLAAGATTITGFFTLSNFRKNFLARTEVNALHPVIQEMPKNAQKFIKSVLKSKAGFFLLVPGLMFAGAFTKWGTLKVNRLGSKEYKVDNEKQLNKAELKKAKKELNWARHKQNFKNFFTGAVDGILAPATALFGGIVGVPAYLLATMGLRSATSKNDGGFVQTLKDNALLSGLFTAAIAIPAFKKAHFSSVLSKNLDTVVKNLKGVNLIKPDLPSSKTALEEISDTLLGSDKIKSIINNDKLSIDEKIVKLTDESLFATKFIQVSNRGDLAKKLIEDCPSSRTIKEAQEEIAKSLGNNDFEVSKLLGVGTVAESYLAKNKTGKEVCIKILKKGINAEKILKDKESFIKIATNNLPKENWTKSQQYLVRNIENMADGLLKEVDFKNEMEAAKKLAKSTKLADVIVPISVKSGVYVMEKAPGISLETLVKYFQAESRLKFMKKQNFNGHLAREIAEYEEKIVKLKAKSPDFKDFDLSVNEINLLLKKYIDVMTEQFVKVDKNGKTLHADIHPGNIFINLDSLKSKKGNLFTLIDTGNTIDLTKEQTQNAIKLVNFIKNGNIKDLTKYVLDNAILPSGLSKEKALELFEKDLKDIFFNYKTKINQMSADEFFTLTNNILRKYDIIPNDTQLTLNKAKHAAFNSFSGFAESFFNKKYSDVNMRNTSERFTAMANATKDLSLIFAKYKSAKVVQETKNLLQMSPREILRTLRNKNMLKTNSEEYLIYQFKQFMKTPAENEKFDIVD